MAKVARWEDWRREEGFIYCASRGPRDGNGGITAIASALERRYPNTTFVHRGKREKDGVPHVMVTCGGQTIPDEEVGRLDQTTLDEARLLSIALLWFGWHNDWKNCDEFVNLEAWEHARLNSEINPVVRADLYEKYIRATASHERRWQALRNVNAIVAAVLYKIFQKQPRPILINDGDNSLVPEFLVEIDPTLAEWILYMHHVPVPRRVPSFFAPYFAGAVRGVLSKGIRFVGLHTPRDRKHFGQLAEELGGDYTFEESVMQVVHASGRVTRLGQTLAGVDARFFRQEATPTEKSPPLDLVELTGEDWVEGLDYVAETDRLDDPQKNGRRKIERADRVFTENPKLKGKFYFLVIGNPSRQGVPVYDNYLANCQKLINEVNSRHQQGSWRPIVLLKKVVTPSTIAKIYGHPSCRGVFVGSKDDGLHLGGFEFSEANYWKLNPSAGSGL